jgi:hypothetical protein
MAEKSRTTEPNERAPVLRERRNLKMAASAHAYVRGNTLNFYEWLAAADKSKIPQGPAIWICGDCHVGNLGPVADKDGKIDIQIRDFDQTVIGNPAHDLIRLGLSLAMAARGSDLPGVTTARMLEEIMLGLRKLARRGTPPPSRSATEVRAGRYGQGDHAKLGAFGEGAHRGHDSDNPIRQPLLAAELEGARRGRSAFRD